MNIKYYFAKAIKFLHIPAIRGSEIHNTSRVASASHIVNTKMGRYSYIGNNCTVIHAEIGSFCSIADNVIVGGASHPINWVSASPIFHNGKNILKQNFSHHEFQTTQTTIIENDVWIGNNSLIKSGVTIKNGAIIGMGSVLTKDVGVYEIWAGNPAKFIRKRFDDNIIDNLLKLNWWAWDDSKLKIHAKLINDPLKFINYCKILKKES